jgi:hypothetical protein
VLPGYKVKFSHTETKDSGNRDDRVTSDGEIDRQLRKSGILLMWEEARIGCDSSPCRAFAHPFH